MFDNSTCTTIKTLDYHHSSFQSYSLQRSNSDLQFQLWMTGSTATKIVQCHSPFWIFSLQFSNSDFHFQSLHVLPSSSWWQLFIIYHFRVTLYNVKQQCRGSTILSVPRSKTWSDSLSSFIVSRTVSTMPKEQWQRPTIPCTSLTR